jgi:hypothetical protein
MLFFYSVGMKKLVVRLRFERIVRTKSDDARLKVSTDRVNLIPAPSISNAGSGHGSRQRQCTCVESSSRIPSRQKLSIVWDVAGFRVKA